MITRGMLTCGCVKLLYEYDGSDVLYFSDPEGLDVDDAYVVTDHDEHFRIFPTSACAYAHAEKLREEKNRG